MTKKTFTFTITLQGTGKTIEDAWHDALVEFHSDPGGLPDDEDVELIDEEEDSEEEREREQLRRDEKNGLYPDRWDDAN